MLRKGPQRARAEADGGRLGQTRKSRGGWGKIGADGRKPGRTGEDWGGRSGQMEGRPRRKSLDFYPEVQRFNVSWQLYVIYSNTCITCFQKKKKFRF